MNKELSQESIKKAKKRLIFTMVALAAIFFLGGCFFDQTCAILHWSNLSASQHKYLSIAFILCGFWELGCLWFLSRLFDRRIAEFQKQLESEKQD